MIVAALLVVLTLVGTLVAPTARAEAQLQLASLSAVVIDAGGQPVSTALVTLTDPLGAELQHVVTDGLGRAVFGAVVPGRYQLRTAAPGAAVFELPVTVSAALPVVLTVRVPATITDHVIVEGARADEPSSRGSIAGESLERIPVRTRTRAMQEVVATLPGWSTEDNGLLHARGVDDGFLYVIDGVPVYERLDVLSGLAPDLAAVSAVNVVSGYVPPEFGHKAGGVIEIRSAMAPPSWSADADVTLGTDQSLDGSLAAGGRLGRTLSIRAGIIAARSDRYLDPVHPDNLHNTGGQSSTFGQMDWSPGSVNRLTAGWGYGRARFDVPNTDDQEEAGQDQRQRIGQGFFNATWQWTSSPRTVSHAAVYHRRTNACLDASLADTPLVANADRALVRTGVLVGVSRQVAAHLLKSGVEWQRLSLDERFEFAVTDPQQAQEAGFRDEVLSFTPSRPFAFAGRAEPSIWSFYAQDAWQLASRLTVNGGVRFDRSELLLQREQWSPRVGVALRTGGATVQRAALSRFFQPPQPENILLSSSPEARVLSSVSDGVDDGGADLEPERQWGFEAGVEHRFGSRLRIDTAYWLRRIRHVADPNVFAGTTIVFPNVVARGRAHGLEMRMEVPRYRGWSAYANWSVARVVQTGPITGGLFLEDEAEELGSGVEFVPDHDQRFAAGGGLTWEHSRSGVALSIVGRHETGTPVQQDEDDLEDLMTRPGAELVDFDTGRVAPRTVVSLVLTAPLIKTERVTASTGVQVLNLLDARYAYNFGNPFSGTHFGARRSAAVTLRVTFR